MRPPRSDLDSSSARQALVAIGHQSVTDSKSALASGIC